MGTGAMHVSGKTHFKNVAQFDHNVNVNGVVTMQGKNVQSLFTNMDKFAEENKMLRSKMLDMQQESKMMQQRMTEMEQSSMAMKERMVRHEKRQQEGRAKND